MKKKREVIAIIVTLVIGLAATWPFLTSFLDFKTPAPEWVARNEGEPESKVQPETELPLPGSVRPLTVLLVGVDSRPGEPSISNTDTLVVAQVNPQTGQIALLSVPRDTEVDIPKYGTGKINMAARVSAGLDSTKNILEKMLGLKLDGFVLTDFAGFKESIDTLGGITLTVEKDMYYETGDEQDGIIDLKQGTQRLNGNQALQYARFRQDALADISRTMRQQAVLKAAAHEFFQLKTLPKLPKVIPQLVRSIKTDLDLTEMLAIANVMVRMNQATVISQTLPGNFVTEEGVSYWRVNTQETKQVARDFFKLGKTVDTFSHRVASQVAQEEKEKVIINKESGQVESDNPSNELKEVTVEIEKKDEKYTSGEKLDRIDEGIVVEVEILSPS